MFDVREKAVAKNLESAMQSDKKTGEIRAHLTSASTD
jgi:hypothetical protein